MTYTRYFRLPVGFLLFFIAGAFAFAQDATPTPPPAPIPDLTGLTLPQAVARLQQFGLELGEIAYAESPSDDSPTNTIRAQTPSAGASSVGVTSVDVEVTLRPNVMLVYDDNDLTFKNEASEFLYIDNIVLSAVDGTTSFSLSSWGELGDELLPDTCIQMWSERRDGAKNIDECSMIRFYRIFLESSVHFWTGADGAAQFRVIQDGIERGVCTIAERRCSLYLPTGVIASDVAEYLYFVYTADSLTLINRTSDRWLPLETLRIAGVDDPFGSDAAAAILAPGQCAVVMRVDASTDASSEQPVDCLPVIDVTTAQPFWVDGFRIRSPFDDTRRLCLAPNDSGESVCILQR